MAIQLGSAYGKVGLDVKGLVDAVRQGRAGLLTLASAGETLGEGMKNVGRNLTLGVTLPLVAVGAASIKAASDFEETKNKAVVVFGEMADSIVASSNKAATTLGLSKTQFLDYASSLGAAFTAGGLGIKESTELAEQAVKHFADLASFHNARVEDVAAAWQSAIRGQYEPIQRYFPFITNQYLITYGTANGLIDANTKQLTANQRAIILNAIALNEELNPAVDDFTETSGGLANQARIMRAQWNDALTMLGTNLLPVALQVVSMLNRMLEAFNNLSPMQQKILLGFLAMAAAAGPLLSALGTLVSIISSIAGMAGTLSGLGISVGTLSTAMTTTLVPAAAAVGTALIPILAVLGAILLTAGLLVIAWKTNFLNIREVMTAAGRIIRSLWSALMAFLRGDMDGTLQHLRDALDTFLQYWRDLFAKFSGIRDAWNNFMTWLRAALTQAREFIRTAFSNVDWGQVGRFIVLGIANGMLLGLPTLLLTVSNVAKSVLDQIKQSLGISSPSAEAMKLGAFTAQGYMLGIQKAMDAEMVANSLARPITNNTSQQQQTIIQNFASGVSLRQVRDMVAQSEERIMSAMIGALE